MENYFTKEIKNVIFSHFLFYLSYIFFAWKNYCCSSIHSGDHWRKESNEIDSAQHSAKAMKNPVKYFPYKRILSTSSLLLVEIARVCCRVQHTTTANHQYHNNHFN